MKTIKISYDKLFDIIQQEEKHNFVEEVEYFQKTPIRIPDENGIFQKIKGLIKKRSSIIEIISTNKEIIRCASNHKLLTIDDTLILSKDCYKGLHLKSTKNDFIISKISELKEADVFDLEIDSLNHLYQIANGTVHHNTLLTAAIIKYANSLNMKTITIVPSSSLLKQTYDYIKQFEIPVGRFGAGKKDDEKNLVATWQTLQNNKPLMRDFECVIWDECHNAKANIAQQIMAEAYNSFIRVGLTGTVPKDPLDRANLTAGFGPVVYEVKAKDLQTRDILSSVNISVIELKYPKKYIGSFVDWHEETMFLQDNDLFHQIMVAMSGTLKGNTLILMKNIDPAETLSETLGCDYISSKLNVNKRQEKFDEFVFNGNITKVGTYSLLSTGIDIVHINNLILAPTPGKSFTKVIQSIGRSLRRKSGEKEHAHVIDMTSNLIFDKKHIKSRIDFYKEAGYPYERESIDLEILEKQEKK